MAYTSAQCHITLHHLNHLLVLPLSPLIKLVCDPSQLIDSFFALVVLNAPLISFVTWLVLFRVLEFYLALVFCLIEFE